MRSEENPGSGTGTRGDLKLLILLLFPLHVAGLKRSIETKVIKIKIQGAPGSPTNYLLSVPNE